MLHIVKIFDFKFSHRRESTRRGGGANFTGAAAFGGGAHPWRENRAIFTKSSSWLITHTYRSASHQLYGAISYNKEYCRKTK